MPSDVPVWKPADRGVTVEYPNIPAAQASMSRRERAAVEIAEVAAVLRDRARGYDLGFLAYLLDMAVIEARETGLGVRDPMPTA